MTSVLKQKDLTKMCRSCIKEDLNSISIFTKFVMNNEKITIYEMLETCTALKIELGDGLPMSICSQCIHELVRTYVFIKKCKKNDIVLKENIFETKPSKTLYYMPVNKNCDLNTKEAHNSIVKDLYSEENEDGNVDDKSDSEICMENFLVKKNQNELKMDSQSLKVIDAEAVKNKNSNLSKVLVDDCTDHNYFALNDDSEQIKNCPKCLVFCLREDFEKHINKHENMIQCFICFETFSTITNLRIHYETHFKETDRCQKCAIVFINQEEYFEHLKSHDIFICCTCGEIFELKQAFDYHNQIHVETKKEFSCKSCNKTFVSFSHFDEHRKKEHTTKGKKQSCRYCDKVFDVPSHLRKHEQIHFQDRTLYTCDICNKGLMTKEDLEYHKLTHLENKVKEFECKSCEKKFSCLRYLMLHNKRQHLASVTKNGVCRYCDKKFDSLAELKTHERRHAKERQTFLCEVCSKQLMSLASLKKHKLVFHQDGEKHYICHICSKAFSSNYKLVEHERRHLGDYSHFCDQCEMKFYTASELRAHYRVHTGQRPYKCAHCPKAYMKGRALTEHLRSHTGIRPYKCSICFKGFQRSNILSKHIKHCGKDNLPQVVQQL